MATIPMTGVSIRGKISTVVKNDKLISELDNTGFAVTQKNSTSKRTEECVLDLSIRDTNFSSFYSFIKSNFGDVHTFTKTGVQPFISSAETNSVRIVDYSKPIKGKEKYYKMNITLRKEP